MSRSTTVDAYRALFAGWQSATPAERALLDAVLDRFARDHAHYSDVLEPSIASDGRAVQTFRFSYAFPTWRKHLDEDAEWLARFAAPFGDGARDACARVVRAARSAVVEQVLFGYAAMTNGEARTKFYLQFRDGVGDAPLRLARTMLGFDVRTESDALPLHLLGLDIGAEGLRGAKLYFLDRAFDAETSAAWLDGWARPLRNVLRIHRIAAREDAGARAPSDIDFALADNALSWSALRASPPFARCAALADAVQSLDEAFVVRVRRISFARAPASGATAYYVLDGSR